METQNKEIFKKLDGDRVPLKKAADATKLWRENMAAQFDESQSRIKAFFIPMEDLEALVHSYKHCGATGARAYLGVVPNPDLQRSDMKLFLVPATETQDFYNNYREDEDTEDHSSVYDFTMPCPDSCGQISELNSDSPLI